MLTGADAPSRAPRLPQQHDAHPRIASLDDIEWTTRPWHAAQAYGDSKLLLAAFAAAIARRWPDVCSSAVDPGWVPTRMGGPGATDDLSLGHVTQCWLAVSDDPRPRPPASTGITRRSRVRPIPSPIACSRTRCWPNSHGSPASSCPESACGQSCTVVQTTPPSRGDVRAEGKQPVDGIAGRDRRRRSATVTIDHPPDGHSSTAPSSSPSSTRSAGWKRTTRSEWSCSAALIRTSSSCTATCTCCATSSPPYVPATEPNIAAATFTRLRTGRLVTIGLLDGIARGGGCELLCGLDLRFGSERSVVGQPEVALGHSGRRRRDGALAKCAPSLVGGRSDILLTGRDVAADELARDRLARPLDSIRRARARRPCRRPTDRSDACGRGCGGEAGRRRPGGRRSRRGERRRLATPFDGSTWRSDGSVHRRGRPDAAAEVLNMGTILDAVLEVDGIETGGM